MHSVNLIKVRLASVLMYRVFMNLHRQNARTKKPLLIMESGVHFALENGGRILIEEDGTKLFPSRPPVNLPTLLLEDGSRLLREDFFPIILENNI